MKPSIARLCLEHLDEYAIQFRDSRMVAGNGTIQTFNGMLCDLAPMEVCDWIQYPSGGWSADGFFCSLPYEVRRWAGLGDEDHVWDNRIYTKRQLKAWLSKQARNAPMNPNESPQARLEAMSQAIFHDHDDPAKETPEVWRDIYAAVALDLITQLEAANARAEAAEAHRSRLVEALKNTHDALDEPGFVRCEHCGWQESTADLDVMSMYIKPALSAILNRADNVGVRNGYF